MMNTMEKAPTRLSVRGARERVAVMEQYAAFRAALSAAGWGVTCVRRPGEVTMYRFESPSGAVVFAGDERGVSERALANLRARVAQHGTLI